MNLITFLKDLSLLGVDLWAEGERLRYRAPKKALSPAALSQIKEHKAKIIQLLQENPDQVKAYPLSYGQQALWFINQLAPESAAYNVGVAFRIHSNVDAVALERAFYKLAARHPLLRSAFPKQGQTIIRELNPKESLDFEVLNVSNWPEAKVQAKVIEAYQHPFNLETGPVTRIRLFSTAEENHIFLLTIHHIACDFWSLGLLMNELGQLYPALLKGQEIALPSINQSYQDYVAWQTKLLAGAEGERLWQYWQQQLAGELPVLNLPPDHPRPPVQTYNGDSHPFALTESLSQDLTTLAQAEGITLNMLLLAAFQIFLYRYTNQEDILVGSLTSGRNQAEFAQIMGYFVNPIVLRANLANNPTCKAFLAQVRQTVLDGIAHQNYPFPLLVERLQVERNPDHSPLFQALFIFQKFKDSEQFTDLWLMPDASKNDSSQNAKGTTWAGLDIGAYPLKQQEGQFDLELEMLETQTTLRGQFKYNTDLFEASTIQQMVKHFQTLLKEIVANPEQSIAEVPLLSQAEQHQIVTNWNKTTIPYPDNVCLQHLIESQAQQTPDDIAIIFPQTTATQGEDSHLTYASFNERANQLAHYLQAQGVGPNTLVGICLNRSPEMLVALLGILKAGGAYVPLDPTYPKDRLAFMISDSQMPVIITESELITGENKIIDIQAHIKLICIDSDWVKISTQSNANPIVESTPHTLAYTIYTSGSTGQPKGVQITHRALLNFLYSMAEKPGLTKNDKLLAVTTISFDIAALELFLPLSVGAQLVLVPQSLTVDGPRLISYLSQYGITLMQATPATWRLLILSGWEGHSTLKILCGGEALTHDLAQQLLTKGHSVWNMYGPTETTIWSAIYQVTKKEEFYSPSVPIGYPIANTQLYILDAHLQPVPQGVVGELYIGGSGLAQGYLNRPDLTNQKFIVRDSGFRIQDSGEAGQENRQISDLNDKQRLYRTGDLARYLPNGTIAFLGRIDNQVKVRGFRIELGEIETSLLAHPLIQEAVVIVKKDTPANEQLVAYIVLQNKDREELHPSEEALIADFKTHLRQTLPSYMIPTTFMVLETLPLTPNGKVNRRMLPAPNKTNLEKNYVAPRTDTEKTLAEIWAKLLNLEQVGVHQNFFDLGGHSLLIVQVHNEIQQTFKRNISVTDLFKYPSISILAQYIEQASQPETVVMHQTYTKQKEAAAKRKQRRQRKRRNNG